MQQAAWKQVEGESRRMTEKLLNELMEAERAEFLGAGHYQRHPHRHCRAAARPRGHRNGFHRRVIDSRYGPLNLRIPGVRSAGRPFRTRLLAAYQRRQRHLERCALEWVAGGMSTRQVSGEMRRAFGAVVSAGTVSRVVAQLDGEIARFRQRHHPRGLRYLYLDRKHGRLCRSRRRGRGRGKAERGAQALPRKAVLLAWGVGHDGTEELIDFPGGAPREEGRSCAPGRNAPGTGFCRILGPAGWWRRTSGAKGWNGSSPTATAAWRRPWR